jgi:hypothetical protein
MFPSRAPYQGPSSSFDLNQDRLGLHAAIVKLDNEINTIDLPIDPDFTDITKPTLPSASLYVGLSSGRLFVPGGQGILAAMSLQLSAYSDNYIDAVVSGTGQDPIDFPYDGSFIYQPSGTYVNSWYSTKLATLATSPINFSEGALFDMQWGGQITNTNGGWGPALLDSLGHGYIVRASNGSGGIYRAVNNAASGAPLAILGLNQANVAGVHYFRLQAQYLGPGALPNTYTWFFTAMVDDISTPLASYTDTISILSPAAVFPAFVCDGGNVYLSKWTWSNANTSPTIAWAITALPTGSPPPTLPVLGRRMYQIVTNSVPLELIDLFSQQSLATRIARLRDSLNSIQRAYF